MSITWGKRALILTEDQGSITDRVSNKAGRVIGSALDLVLQCLLVYNGEKLNACFLSALFYCSRPLLTMLYSQTCRNKALDWALGLARPLEEELCIVGRVGTRRQIKPYFACTVILG